MNTLYIILICTQVILLVINFCLWYYFSRIFLVLRVISKELFSFVSNYYYLNEQINSCFNFKKRSK